MNKKQLNKKQIIIIVLLISIGVPAFIIYTNYKKPSSSLEFDNDYKRAKYVEKFSNKEKGTDSNKNNLNNESGYTGVIVQNKQELLSALGTDGMISINEMLIDAFPYIPKFYKESQNLKDSAINQYYNNNIDTINYTFGIKDIIKFKKILNEFSFIENNGKIVESSIKSGSVKKIGNEVGFELILKSSNGKSQIFKIQTSIQKNGKDNKLIYWN
ncbi:hypothetical protein [Clostridium estertheticum]|uniref:hypothetical protein n=1 Tax=Clostridium estertheticum TaxID=238834 RepID=UPI001C0B56C3|nr:hypothetical protein [Clostridium estertheticum]MBU3173287.1 hypothetical protein [Clostridium estertheticum]